ETVAAEAQPAAPTEPHNQQVLIIEDDDLVAEQLADLVRGRGLVPILAESGEEGLRLARLNRPRGIILDIKLPDTDGWTVMDRLKADPATSGIPVHFLSALDAPLGQLTRGAVGYLTKPATSQELIELIYKLAPKTTSTSQRVMVVEDSAAEGRSIVALLESEHFEAVHVSSAETALDMLGRSAFGCIILDLSLVNMDGLAFLDALRKRPDLGPYGIIVHTGRSLTKQEINLLQANSQAIVLKDGNSSARLLEEVRLFVHHVKEAATTKAEPSATVVPELSRTLQDTCVLLAEDDMRTVYSLSALLQSRGCEVLVAENGREALELLAHHDRIKCLITDIMMPEMDGYETMAHIRAQSRFQNLPIVALTARAMPGERERCLAKGADAYLTKPVDAQQLIATLVSLLEEKHAS
ncbi:MAG TPA: response regulator, partial [Polyangiaceae bacterium]|nr:response regulator [Polyangiaceae bacterium]